MAYETEMREIARRSRARWGPLQEVVFFEANRNSRLVFAQTAIRADKLPETDILTFGYSGTGPSCYRTFLAELGFREPNVEQVTTPAKLTADGQWTRGVSRSAQWTAEAEGQSVEEARTKLPPFDSQASCILREEILSEGLAAEITEAVHAAGDADAIAVVQRRLPSGSAIVSSQVEERAVESTEEILADRQSDPSSLARAKIKASEAPYKTLLEVSCVTEPRGGFLGLGKRAGKFLARYRTVSREVHLVFRPPARIRVAYGPKKLTCSQCGQVMACGTEGVYTVAGPPSPEAEIVKLRCEACDITRFEKRWEIEGTWVEWEDGSPSTIL